MFLRPRSRFGLMVTVALALLLVSPAAATTAGRGVKSSGVCKWDGL